MRYTRYDYNKFRTVKFLLNVGIVAIVSILIGLSFSRFVFRGGPVNIKNSVNSTEYKNDNIKYSIQSIIGIQCGYYSKKENAEMIVKSIESYCNPFVVEDDGKYRIVAGIYNEGSAIKKLDSLKSHGIDVAKLDLSFQNRTEDDKKITEIINGFLQITDRFEDGSIKSINTSKFKEWVDNIIDGDIGEGDIKDVYNFMKNLPNDLSRDTSKSSVEALYFLIKNKKS